MRRVKGSAAIAARTSRLAIMLAAVPLPFWDPVRLAEEICALDIIISGRRVAYVLGLGHRAEEYQHFGCEPVTRGRVADEHLRPVLRLLSGEVVDHRGRRIRVPPAASPRAVR